MKVVKLIFYFFQWNVCGRLGQAAAGHVGKVNKPELLKFLHNMVVENAVEAAPKTVISENVQVGQLNQSHEKQLSV